MRVKAQVNSPKYGKEVCFYCHRFRGGLRSKAGMHYGILLPGGRCNSSRSISAASRPSIKNSFSKWLNSSVLKPAIMDAICSSFTSFLLASRLN